MLQSMGLQRVGHHGATEQQQQMCMSTNLVQGRHADCREGNKSEIPDNTTIWRVHVKVGPGREVREGGDICIPMADSC